MQAHKAEEIKTLKMALREQGRERTYSNGDSDRVDLLYSPSRVQQWAPLEKLMRYGSGDLERSQRKKRVGGFREIMTVTPDEIKGSTMTAKVLTSCVSHGIPQLTCIKIT